METEFMKLMEQIMDSIANDNYKNFLYDGKRFHFVDNDRLINFEAIIGENGNYYLRDNVTDSTYIVLRKYLRESTFIYNVLMQRGNSGSYIAFFAKDGFPGIIKLCSIDSNGELVCKNPDCIDRLSDREELLEYIDEYFEYEPEDDEEEDVQFEDDDVDKAMLDIEGDSEFECVIEEQEQDVEEREVFEYGEDDGEDVFENEFLVTINRKEVQGEEKYKVISGCALDVTRRYEKLGDVAMFVENLRLLLRDLEHER